MPSLFAGLEHEVSTLVNEVMGEPTRLVPKTKGEYFGSSADSTRVAVDVVGAVTINPVAVLAQDKGTFDGMQPSLAADRVHVSYDERLLPYKPQQGDEIILTGRQDLCLRIVRVDPDGCGRLEAVCTYAGVAP